MSEKLREGWHLDKRVNPSIVFTFLTSIILVAGFVFVMRKDVDTNATAISAIMATQEKIEENQRDLRAEDSLQAAELSGIKEQIIGLRRDIGRFLNERERQRYQEDLQ